MAKKKWLRIHAGLLPYDQALELQLSLVAARLQGRLSMDAVLFLEHPPVFTMGLRGGRENLLVSEDFLAERGIAVIQTRRGGNITYHGPGQLVVYPILDLNAVRLGLREYVERLEDVMQAACADFGISAIRSPANRGIWAGPRKLGSIGVAVRKGICFHGLALNVNLSLLPFEWINPCGLNGIAMTSLALETGREVSLAQARQSVQHHMAEIFQREDVPADINHSQLTIANE